MSTELLPVVVYIHALQACISKPTESNLHRLRAGSLQALCVLQWGCSLSDHPYGPAKLQPDLILGSDITYDSAQFLPLLQTIAAYAVVKHNVQVALLLFLSSSSMCLHHMPSQKTVECLLSCISSTAAAAMARHCICCINSASDPASTTLYVRGRHGVLSSTCVLVHHARCMSTRPLLLTYLLMSKA